MWSCVMKLELTMTADAYWNKPLNGYVGLCQLSVKAYVYVMWPCEHYPQVKGSCETFAENGWLDQ